MENVTLPTSAGRMSNTALPAPDSVKLPSWASAPDSVSASMPMDSVSPEGPAVKIVQQRFGRKQQYRRQKQQAGGDRKAAFVFLLREKLHMPLKLLSLRFVLLR